LERKIDETEKKYEEASKLCEERLKQVVDTEKKYEEASRLCEERLKQVVDTETKLIELKTSMQRLSICILYFPKVSMFQSFLCYLFSFSTVSMYALLIYS